MEPAKGLPGQAGHVERRPLWGDARGISAGPVRRILVTGGASCPDGIIQQVISRINSFYPASSLRDIRAVLSDLAEKIDPDRLLQAARNDDDLPSAQRLGFLLEHIGEEAKLAPLAEWVKRSQARSVTLRPGGSMRRARKSSRWKVMVNEDIEVSQVLRRRQGDERRRADLRVVVPASQFDEFRAKCGVGVTG